MTLAQDTSVDALAENFPTDLMRRRQWLVWRFVNKPGQAKPAKLPYYATTGEPRGWPLGKPKDGEATAEQPQVEQGHELDRAHLVSFDEAFEAAGDLGFDGIGFAFLPGDGLIGIDLDIHDDPEKQARADAIVRACASWTEVSPSGKGLHIIVAGETETFKHNGIGVEVFCGRQFFTMSGRHLEGSPLEVRPIAGPVLAQLRRTVEKAKKADREAKDVAAGQPEQSAPSAPPPRYTADESGRVRLYCMTALSRAVDEVSGMGQGGRNDALNSETYGLASLIWTGMIDEATIRAAMEQAAARAGLPKGEARATINSAIRAGMRNKKAIPEPDHKPRARVQQAASVPVHDPETGEIIEPTPANDNDEDAAIAAMWPEPIDLFGVTQPPELPIDVLPEAFRDYVRDQAALLGCDPAIIGLCALVSAAACIDDGIELQPKRHDMGWTEQARLWVAVVGDPSARKSPAIAKATRCVRKIDMGMAESNAVAMADYLDQHAQWKDAKKASKGEPMPPEPKKPAIQRLVVEDTTIEALSDVLKDNPRGVLTVKDELTGWFASMDAYKGGGKGASMDRALWLEAYNGGRRIVDRVQRGNIIVPNWSTCMIGGIQPDMMRRISSNMGNDGLLQRFMVLVARPAGDDVDRVPDLRAVDRFRALFDHLVSIKPSGERIHLSDDAHEVRERLSKRAGRMIAAFDHPHIQAWLGKWTGLFGRLLLTYHVIECAADRTFPTQRKVSGETALMVERLMCDVLLHHAIHFYTEVIDAHERQENVRQLARTILAKGFERITKRDLTLHWKSSRKLEAWETRATIEALCNMAWLEPEADSTDPMDGKPRAWVVNPRVHEMFAAQADREAERRRAAAEVVREIKQAARR